MKATPIRWLTFFLTIAALVGFTWVYWKLLRTDWSQTNPPNANFEFLASSLTGLVGGIVAAAFGQRLPTGPAARGVARIRTKLHVAGSFLPFAKEPPRTILTVAYILVYFGFSAWAIYIFAQNWPSTPKLTNNLAVISMGLYVAIVTSYFAQPDPHRPSVSESIQIRRGTILTPQHNVAVSTYVLFT